MSRYNKEVRVVYYGDKDLASRYLAEGRKYLGMLDDSRSVPTQTRVLTNPDGVTFRVGFYYDQPFIEITAGKSFGESYQLIAHRGYVVAPRTVSYTAYSTNPAVIINPFAGIETLWGSSFFDDPGELNGSTHPTSVYSDAFATYGEYFPNLSGNTLSRSSRFSSPQLMSWNNSDESVWLYWYGCEHGRANHIWRSEVFHNGVFLFDLDDYLNSIMMLGLSAKRTDTGLLVTMTAINKISVYSSDLILCSIELNPTAAEKERLDKINVKGSYGYAAEYEADMDTFTILSTTNIAGTIRYYSSHPHNQSGNESRGFIGVDSGGVVNLTEWVIDYKDRALVLVAGMPGTTVIGNLITTTTYGDTIFNAIINQHCTFMGFSVPPHTTYGVGTYTFDTSTVPVATIRYNTGDGGSYVSGEIFPAQYDSSVLQTVTPSKIKCFVDYSDDVPVYAYLHISNATDVTEQTCTWSSSESPAAGTLNLEVFAGAPLTSSWDWVTHSSVSTSRTCEYSRQQTHITYGISAPNYLNGIESGNWLYEIPSSSTDTLFSSTGNSTIVTGYSNAVGYSGTKFLAEGTLYNVPPYTETIDTVSEALSVFHLNLRTKSAFYQRDQTVSSVIDTSSPTAVVESYLPVGVMDRVRVIFDGKGLRDYDTVSESKKRTAWLHAGAVKFDSGYIVTSSSTSNNNYDSGFGHTCGPIKFKFVTNTNAYVAANVYSNSATNPTVDYDVCAYRPDPDVSTNIIQTPSMGPPFASSYASRSGQPSSSVGIATTKDSYIANVNYASGLSNAYSALALTNDVGYTLDYMTGAHAAQWYSPPYLLSAIALKQIKL